MCVRVSRGGWSPETECVCVEDVCVAGRRPVCVVLCPRVCTEWVFVCTDGDLVCVHDVGLCFP